MERNPSSTDASISFASLYDHFLLRIAHHFCSSLLTCLARSLNLLKDEFRSVPVKHITNVFKDQKTLFKTYIVLERQIRGYNHIVQAYAKPAKPRNKHGVELVLIERGSQLPKELRAAKKKIEKEAGKCEDLLQICDSNTFPYINQASQTP